MGANPRDARDSVVRVRRWAELAGWAMMAAGGIVVLAQAGWISYGVVMRYVFRSPDAVVTEATALLLFPVAFAGLVHAMRADAYPRVTALVGNLAPDTKRRLEAFNCLLMSAVAAFFATAAAQAAWRDFHSGAASEILLWPRYLFWTPSALSLMLFALYAGLRFAEIALGGGARPE